MNLFNIIVKYDNAVRFNNSLEFPSIHNVAFCKEGIYGAWGEVLDDVESEVTLTELEYDTLHDLFLAYQASLRMEMDSWLI